MPFLCKTRFRLFPFRPRFLGFFETRDIAGGQLGRLGTGSGATRGRLLKKKKCERLPLGVADTVGEEESHIALHLTQDAPLTFKRVTVISSFTFHGDLQTLSDSGACICDIRSL